jgi:hypothetical protein
VSFSQLVISIKQLQHISITENSSCEIRTDSGWKLNARSSLEQEHSNEGTFQAANNIMPRGLVIV